MRACIHKRRKDKVMSFEWTGRLDGNDPLYHRIFQRVEVADNSAVVSNGDFFLHGFSVDEGVLRNKGRVGAAEAPDIIRKNFSNFPVVKPEFRLIDLGNISCGDGNLEIAQTDLAMAVSQGLQRGGKSIVFGGGHEVMYAHFSGIKKAFPEKKIGIVNFDAHFDNREPSDGRVSSGTGFWQIAQEEPLHSLHIGIQRNSNTLKLFDDAHKAGMKYILAEELFFENLPKLYLEIDAFSNSVDVVYITLCMDVFNAAIAPGVSAPAYNGIFADTAFMHLFKHVLKNEKLIALDVAEVNPQYDIGERTARLAAALVNEWLII